MKMIETQKINNKVILNTGKLTTHLEPCADYTNIVHSLQVCVKSLSGQGTSSVKSRLAKPHFRHLLIPRIYGMSVLCSFVSCSGLCTGDTLVSNTPGFHNGSCP